MTLTFNYSNGNQVIAGIKIVMTESDGTITILTTDANGQVTLPTTSNTYTLSASFTETGDDPISLIDAIQILQYGGELRDLTEDQKTAADVNQDGEVDVLDAIWILQHLGELRTLDGGLIFLDANTGKPLSETTFNPGDTPSISVIRLGDVDGDFDPSLITDHAPILTGKTTLTVDENEVDISTLVASDADGDTLTYSITGGADQDLFTINESTGVLSFITGPDYEDPSDAGFDNLYDVEISVSDGSNTTIQALVVSVLDLNEKLGITNKTISENEDGATVGDLSIIDTAFGNSDITYALSGDDAQYFVLDGTTIKLKSDVSANYEVQSRYTITVTATNAGGETITEKVVVKIENVNEGVNLVTALSNQSNDEDAGFSFTVPNTTFTDIDGDALTYSVTLSDGQALPTWLSFNAITRTFTGTPLNNDVGVINVTVTASDGSFSASNTFSLTVVNTNDEPTAVALSGNIVNENSSGAVVGSLSTIDVDVGDTHTYALSGNDAASFEVVNGQLKLKAGLSANYEIKTSYDVTVTATDGSGSTTAQSFSIDVNATPTSMDLSNLSIDESNYGLTIGSLSSSDPNSNDSFSYTIIGGSDSSFFEINALGELKLKDTKYADYEVDDTLTVTIRTTDQGGLSFEKTFNISVNDLAYATPDVSDIKPQSIPSSGNDIIDNLLLGFSIDYDHDPSTPLTITYSLIGTNSAFAFSYGDLYAALGDQFTDRIENGSAAWEALVDQAFAYWAEITGINFVKVEETATQCGDIRVGLQSSWAPDTEGPLGFSFGGSSYASAAYDVWFLAYFDPENSDFDPRRETPEFVLIHEIGHSLGLAHPHDWGGDSTAIFDPGLTDAYTVMSYSGRGNILNDWDIDGDGTYEYESEDAISAVSPSIYDIKAIQYIYGMTPSLNGGDNNYIFSGPVFETIYDTGGQDTIDLSSYSQNITLDLTPGTVSYIGTDEIRVQYNFYPLVNDDGNTLYKNGNTGFPISIAEGTIIEDATTGSGDDEITCNVAVNSITCGLGDDTVFTISTGDSIYGGGGDDWFYISEANFTIIEGGAGNDSLLLESIGSSFDLSDFTDAQITGIENIDIQWVSDTLLTLTKQDILNLGGDIAYDLDGDGDDDYVTWILGDSGQDNILLNAEGWSRDSNASSTYTYYGYGYNDYYTNDNGDTYFATSGGVGVYEKTSDGDISITDQSVAENRADAAVGILSKDGLTQLSPFGSLFTVTGPDADKFQVSSDGTTLRLKTGTALDYETQSTYNITITVLGVSQDYQITVVDGEENEITGQHWSVAASETITGTAADDFIDYDGGDDTIDGKSGNDILIIEHDKTTAFEIITAGGITKIKVDSSASIDYAYDEVKMINVESIKFNDRYVSLSTTLPAYDSIIWGTSSSEDLSPTSGSDLIDSAGGNDKILDNGGDDTLAIFGYRSNFEVMTVAGITKIYGDTNVSGIGSAYYGDIIKTIDVESIAFTDKTITLDTTYPSGTAYVYWDYSSSSETITASDEIDLIDGSGGSDDINGKGGNDTLAIFSDKANFEIITLAGLTKIYGTTYVSGLGSNYWADTIRMSNVENIAFADQTITVETSSIGGNYIAWGSTSSTTIDGTDGNDVIDSGGGSDYINGKGGDDTLLLFGNRDDFEMVTLAGLTKIYGLNYDGLMGAYYGDTIKMQNVETIMFADQTITVETSSIGGNYKHWGSTSGTTIDGTDGNDVIDSGGGSDKINGKTGDDTLLLYGDKADFEIITLAGLTKIYGLNYDGLMGAYYGDTIRLMNTETIMFADQTITVETSSIGGNYYYGTLNNSYDIRLTDVDDVIDSAGGNEIINGKGGDDTLLLYGDKADFEIITLAGLTKIYGLNYDGLMGAYYGDTIKMQNVETIMFADQTITVETSSIGGNYKHWGSTSGTTIDGTDGNDVIDSGGGSDKINGKTGDDTLLLYGDKADFEIITLAGLTKIYGLNYDGLMGAYYGDTIRLMNTETIMFADQTITVETSSIGGNYYYGTLNNSYDIRLTDVDDVIDSAGGNEIINGKGGDDTLLLYGDKADFEIITLAGLTKIYGLNYDGLMGAYYGDTIKMQNVETIMFADQTITVETSSIGGNYKHWGSTSGTTIDGTDGNDVIDSGGGSDKINGKTGDDTLLLYGDKADFEIITLAGLTKIYGLNYDGLMGAYYGDTIRLMNTETIMFADQTITVETSSIGGNYYYGTLNNSYDIRLTDVDDVIDSAGGNEIINGKGGDDTLLLYGDKADFEIITLAGLTKIYGLNYDGLMGAYYGDTIKMQNVETIMFADQTITVETSSIGGNYKHWGSTSGTTIDGTDGNDVIDSGGGSDKINGKTGDDTLLLYGDKADFEIITLAGLTKIYGLNYDGLMGAYYGDTIKMYSVETIMFADQTITVETSGLAGTDSYNFWGSTSGTTIDGTDGNDVIDSGGGSDTIDGGAGDDTLLLFADKSTFDITINGDTITLTGNSSEGLAYAYWLDTITLTNVETIMFADQTVQVSDLISDSGSEGGAIDNNDTNDNDIVDAPDNEDTPMDSDLPDLSFWTNDYDLSFITLPDTVVEAPIVLTDALLELIEIPIESIELIFPLNGDAIHMDKVVNSAVNEINLDPLLQNDWQAVLEEYIYTSELG